MAYFASTTTSGYSDPLKAQSIKALEQRMKDQLAQAAAAPGITPENTQTPIQGFGHVANQLADQFLRGRTERAAAEGRNELSGIIAQGPQGADGNWSPQQLAVMVRRDPEQASKFFQNAHDLRFQKNDITGQNLRNQVTADTSLATNRLTNETSAANTLATNASQERRTAAEQGGATGRTELTTFAENQRHAERIAAEKEMLGSKQAQEADMARLNAQLDDAKQQKLFAQQSGLADKANEHQKRIVELTAELGEKAARNKETFEASQLQTKIANDTEMKALDRQLTRENLAINIAASKGDTEAKLAAEERRQALQLKWEERKQAVGNEHAEDMQEAAETAKFELQKRQIASDEGIAAKKIAAEAGDPTKVKAALDLNAKLTQKQLLTAKFERAEKDLDHPGGLHIGSSADLKVGASNWLGLGSRAKAERTTRVNTAMNEMGLASMADTLTGPTTNFELEEFRKAKNNQNVGWDELKTRYKAVLAAMRKDTAAAEAAVRKTGGDASDPTKPAAATVTAPAGGGKDVVVDVPDEAAAMALKAGTRFRLKDGRTGTAE